MFKKYSFSLLLSTLLSALFLGILFLVSYLLDGNLESSFFIYFVLFLVNLILCTLITQRWTTKYISSKTELLYDILSSMGISIQHEKSKRNLRSLTRLIQQFTDEKKTEIDTLKEREDYRREFVGNISHEIKTPIFTIQGYILTLLENKIEDKVILRKYLKKAARSVERLNYIANDLDLITQFESGVIRIKNEKFNLSKLISNAMDVVEMQSKKKNISLLFEQKANPPIWVIGDEDRMMQVLINLIINSLKYGIKNGTTEIIIDDLDTKKVSVRVIDNGKGIAEEHHNRLFERFYRTDVARNKNEGGSGLGLSIVKHIVEAHNENVFVESALGVGSEFSFTMTKATKK